MSNLKLLLTVTVFAFFFTSCTEDADPSKDSLIIGTWTMTHSEASSLTTTNSEDYSSSIENVSTYENIDITAEFKEDGTLTSKGTADISTVMYFDASDSLVFGSPNTAIYQVAKWSIDGTELLLTETGENTQTLPFEIVSLTDNELIMTSHITQEVSQSGTSRTTEITARVEYKR
ncbi:hypothetical protein [Flammeovirga kamogawensis]|uniref:Lipocalin-like domain-containing protein n=1 Tax=Flammeovirga kamogawensis TaxID=373891 RepID=A0ABX8GYX1_9BACT|nr:hypothetical protein [Flammeovirga kamogawensis]MBB6459006.1 hypothetical protein [Flammeovirga kamogawensis]QWG08579.1 hypothetical protein KM029_06480 [Flammeovirga kamogawensis]TRX66872.1 hypothetical protein EO216_01525 [Flammeovirga kamogawensis]